MRKVSSKVRAAVLGAVVVVVAGIGGAFAVVNSSDNNGSTIETTTGTSQGTSDPVGDVAAETMEIAQAAVKGIPGARLSTVDKLQSPCTDDPNTNEQREAFRVWIQNVSARNKQQLETQVLKALGPSAEEVPSTGTETTYQTTPFSNGAVVYTGDIDVVDNHTSILGETACSPTVGNALGTSNHSLRSAIAARSHLTSVSASARGKEYISSEPDGSMSLGLEGPQFLPDTLS